jgi:hypothetical protein
MSADVIHLYVSTACQHGVHAECRRECKFCTSPCLCPCHVEELEVLLKDVPRMSLETPR